MSKLIPCDYDHYNIVKCCWNVNFEEVDIEPLIGKNDKF